MCNKYIQRKLQLVDVSSIKKKIKVENKIFLNFYFKHLKSKKHHKKIHEKRKQSQMVNQPTPGTSKSFQNVASTRRYTRKINFVPAQNNYSNFYQQPYGMYYQTPMQSNYGTKRKLEKSTPGNLSKKQAIETTNFNPAYYGYGYDQSNTTNEQMNNYYWNTQDNNNNNPHTSNYNHLSSSSNQIGYRNFTMNMLSSITSLQYATEVAAQNALQNQSNYQTNSTNENSYLEK